MLTGRRWVSQRDELPPSGERALERSTAWRGSVRREHGLVDELRLKIFPVVLGAGEGLFGETSDKKPMQLVDTQTVEGDVVLLTYEVAREA